MLERWKWNSLERPSAISTVARDSICVDIPVSRNHFEIPLTTFRHQILGLSVKLQKSDMLLGLAEFCGGPPKQSRRLHQAISNQHHFSSPSKIRLMLRNANPKS